jgi:hypothetical protein
MRPPGDAGADAQVSQKPPEKKRETSTFVSVEQAHKLAESLAPLYAFRSVGKIEDSRAEEFGLHKPEGTLRVKLDGKERSLVIGGTTPGGADRYARLDTGEVYAIPGSIAQNVMFAESRLVERELHGFEPEEATRARIVKGEQSRELVRIEDKKDGWATASSPGVLDETAGNWMTKLGRLRVMSYVENPRKPVAPEDLVVRVEYFDKGSEVGFLELVKLPPKLPAPSKPQAKADYLVRTRTRAGMRRFWRARPAGRAGSPRSEVKCLVITRTSTAGKSAGRSCAGTATSAETPSDAAQLEPRLDGRSGLRRWSDARAGAPAAATMQ